MINGPVVPWAFKEYKELDQATIYQLKQHIAAMRAENKEKAAGYVKYLKDHCGYPEEALA